MDALTSPRAGGATLAAVVFTDVVGYSARMQRDEAATIRLVQSDLDAMRERAAMRGGQCLNTMGDGMMLAFASATDAVGFALDLQRDFAQRTDPSALQHRIGIHLGDVFRLDSGQLAGDGVNVAARLESAAPPGGVCVSQAVYDVVKGKLPLKAVFAGRRGLKNIAEPVPVWHLIAPGSARRALRPRVSRRMMLGTAAAACGLAAAGIGWRFVLPRWLAADKTLAVLPFANLSEDKDAAYFADGVHEDLLTQLALLRDLKVVSRTSVLEYRSRTKNARQIAGELGVAALVEGSVRRAGDMIRVTAQLIDARSDTHVWAKQYDRELKDIFSVQSELATEIARALQVSLSPPEKERLARMPTKNMEAYDLYLRHQAMVSTALGLRSVAEHAIRAKLLERAIEIDPSFARAWARLGSEHARAYAYGIDWSEQRREKARVGIDRALALAPSDPTVRLEEGYVALRAFHDHTRAVRSYERVLEDAPNNAEALYGLALVCRDRGETARAVRLLQQADAFDPRNALVLHALARTYAEYRQFEKSQTYRVRLISLHPDDTSMRGAYALVEYWRTGSWDAYDAWRRSVPEAAEQRLTGVRWNETKRATARGDYLETLRLLEMQSADFDATTSTAARLDRENMIVLAALAAGNRTMALERARSLLNSTERELRVTPHSAALWENKAEMHAVLGEREAAFAAFGKAVDAAQRTGSVEDSEDTRRAVVALHALLGEKGAAIAEFARQSRLPRFWVHEQKVNLALASLHSDARFKAIVEDPASNAPLPLEMRLDGQIPR